MGDKEVKNQKKVLPDDLKKYITEKSKEIIFDSIPKQDLDKYLYSINILTNDNTELYETAILNIFPIPHSINDIVCVNVVVLDLDNKSVSAPPSFFAPIALRKNTDGIESDAVIVGRYGDISITNASLVFNIAPIGEIDAYYNAQKLDSVERVEGEVL